MVRLKAQHSRASCGGAMRFQFQNGTIKRAAIAAQVARRQMFQFQNGTIKRNRPRCAHTAQKAFQFQNGTIKRP